jgi:hypothetical protein
LLAAGGHDERGCEVFQRSGRPVQRRPDPQWRPGRKPHVPGNDLDADRSGKEAQPRRFERAAERRRGHHHRKGQCGRTRGRQAGRPAQRCRRHDLARIDRAQPAHGILEEQR